MTQDENLLAEYIMSSINLDDIDGISCKIIHPKLAKRIEELSEGFKNGVDLLTPAQEQLASCLTTEVFRIMSPEYPISDDSVPIVTDFETINDLVYAAIKLAFLTLEIADEYEKKAK